MFGHDRVSEDFSEAIMEYEEDSTGLTYRYTYGLQKNNVVIYNIPNSVGAVAQTFNYPNGAERVVKLFYHHDRLGSTDILTNNVNGDVTSIITYDQWGHPLMKSIIRLGVRELNLVTEYTGHMWDPVLEAYYARARMYDSADRRFMAVDPVKGLLANPQSLAQFTYCLSNPILYTDPFGLAPLPFPGFIHRAVQLHIQANNPTYRIEQRVDFGILWGRADVISDDGQVWEIKSEGQLKTPGQIQRAQGQVVSYTTGTWHNRPNTRLSVGHDLIAGSFTLYSRWANYYVEYGCIGGGVIKYSYKRQNFEKEQIIEDIGTVVMIGATAVVIVATKGLAAPVLVPAFIR